jgi:threonine dehydratase
VYQTWKSGQPVCRERITTFAEGLASRVPFELPLRILREHLDDMVLVTDAQMRAAMRLLLETTHTVAEPAGAAATAAALALRARLRGRTVAIILSGGNATLETLRTVLT